MIFLLANGLGDRLVRQLSSGKTWEEPVDAVFTIKYPNPGLTGAVVTHVNIDVKQVCVFTHLNYLDYRHILSVTFFSTKRAHL